MFLFKILTSLNIMKKINELVSQSKSIFKGICNPNDIFFSFLTLVGENNNSHTNLSIQKCFLLCIPLKFRGTWYFYKKIDNDHLNQQCMVKLIIIDIDIDNGIDKDGEILALGILLFLSSLL